MYKNKSFEIIFSINSNFIDISPSISICINERNIIFRWIIFEIDITY